MHKKILLLMTLGFASCGSLNNRNPASFSTTVFSDVVRAISSTHNSLTTDSAKCTSEMQQHYDKLFDLVGSSVYFDMDNLEVLDQDIQRSFETRLELKESLRDFTINNEIDKACFSSIANVFKALRYIEDYMIEMRVEKSENAANEYVNMKGDFPYLLVNPRYKNDVKSYEDLKSGDVILSRGGAYSSAAIARIGENDFQFSHLSFVYRNPLENDKMYTTEAHIEIGSVTAPFEDHLNEKNSRSVVFRYSDINQAHEASEYMYKRVKARSETGKNIEYDFSMNYKDDSKLFCSEIISSGFHHVLPKEDYIPKFKSNFTAGIIPFLNNIGVNVNSENVKTMDVFSPGDIQFDPRFDLVMEWRNPKKMEESRVKDFILTKLFEKMDKENYIFDPSLKMDVQTKTFWLLRRMPIVKKFIEKKFPINMSAIQMEMFMALDKVGEILYKEVEKKSIESDHTLTPKEIYIILDEYLTRDSSLAKPLIEKYFHKK